MAMYICDHCQEWEDNDWSPMQQHPFAARFPSYKNCMVCEECAIELEYELKEVSKGGPTMTNRYVQFVDEVHHEISIDELCGAMTEGQRQHMANHLWLHYTVGAQKLEKLLEEAQSNAGNALRTVNERAGELGSLREPKGKRVNVDGVDYILVRDGE